MSEPLFNPKPDRLITAYDLFGKKHKRNLKDFSFRISAYGVLRKGDKILVQRHPKLQQYGLPGGGIELGETIEEALLREFREETGLKVKAGKLLNATEDFFTARGLDCHSILLFYEVALIGGRLLADGNGTDTGEVKYVKLSTLDSQNTQRVFAKIVKTLRD